MTIKRYLYAGLGLLFLGLGGIGVIIPIIPTTPFLLLTSFFFLRSSERLNTWFEGTRMYKRFIANFMETRSLTLRAKILCAAPGVTAMPMLALVVPQWWLKAILIGLTVFEIWYFIARIETVSVEEARARGKARVAEAKRDQAASAASAFSKNMQNFSISWAWRLIHSAVSRTMWNRPSLGCFASVERLSRRRW